MKKYLYSILAIGLGISIVSCDLDVMPKQDIGVTDDETQVVNAENIGIFVNGLYQSFRGVHYGVYSYVGELTCDGFNATVDFGNNYGGIHRMDATFTTSDYDSRDIWAGNYIAIKNYNVFLSNIENFETSSDTEASEKEIAKGEATFFRAYSYLTLVRYFGKAYDSSTASSDLAVPLIIKYDQEEKPSRATVQQVYDQIKVDLDTAAACLASVSGEIASDHITIDAVYALYARYYLDIKDYEKAAEYANMVISSSAGYKLSSTADEMYAEYINDAGTEPILQLAASAAENGSGTNDTYTRCADWGAIVYRSYFLPSQKLIDAYSDASDLRFAQWFDASGYSYLGGDFHRLEYYTFVKYYGNPELRSDNTPNARQHVKPFMISEMYLIAAEAEFNLGNTDAAKTALNTLQSARQATATEATAETIQNEWFRETVGEGMRFFCLKRWGIGYSGRALQPGASSAAVVVKGASYEQKDFPADDYHWLLPVPSYEMRVNDNLVQNDGYAE
jgi:hypothetical protein